MPTIISKTPEETTALGEAWAHEATAGWVIGLVGDLGAGKTQFVKGFARGLGYSGRVQSPTFGLVNEYSGGRLPLFHLDLYRLDTREQIMGAGLEDYLYNPKGVAIIEWMDRWLGKEENPSGMRGRMVRFSVLSETDRQIDYEDFGA